MKHIWYLTETIGPRLTNSPNMRRASNWTREQFAQWGLKAHLEPFGPWGRGWSLQHYTANVVAPDFQPVLGYPAAWSPSTKGVVTADVVALDINKKEDLAKYEGKVKDKIVLVSKPRELREDFAGIFNRFSDGDLAKLIERGNQPVTRPTGQPSLENISPQMRQQLEAYARNTLINSLISREKPALVIETGPMGSQGAVMVHAAAAVINALDPEVVKHVQELTTKKGGGTLGSWLKEAEPFLLPTLVLANEDYNRIYRQVQNNIPVKMSVDIRATYHDEDMMAHNVIAEIPGTDPKLKDEIVMLGAHLDSWHASKGATDNAAGCGVVMEAIRILTAAGFKPRRTIRAALWSGEEQGLHGSREYVKKHFATLPNPTKEVPKPQLIKAADYDKLSVYFNLDNGGGRIRGLYLMGNADVKPIFEEWLKPFNEMGAKTLTLVSRGSTDHVSFDRVGLPGFGFIQDPLNYDLAFGPRSHHTNLDNYDRIPPDDIKQAATVMAAFVYQTAMMDEKLPRKGTNK
jgi:hypothetical protein